MPKVKNSQDNLGKKSVKELILNIFTIFKNFEFIKYFANVLKFWEMFSILNVNLIQDWCKYTAENEWDEMAMVKLKQTRLKPKLLEFFKGFWNHPMWLML